MDKSWQSNLEASLKTCYQVSNEVIKVVAENLFIYGKFQGTLDQQQQSNLHNSGTFIPPSQGLTILKGKAKKESLPTGQLKSTNIHTQRGSKKKGRKTPSSTSAMERHVSCLLSHKELLNCCFIYLQLSQGWFCL